MNKKNNSTIKNTFFGYNLYSSSFAPIQKQNEISQKKKSSQNRSTKNSSSSVPTVKKHNNIEKKDFIETIHEESFHSNDNNNSTTSLNIKREKGNLMTIVFDDKLNNNIQMNNSMNDNMKVMVRVRPPLPREIEFGVPFRSICEVSSNNTEITISEYVGNSTSELERQHELIHKPSLFHLHRFTFDYVFDQDTSQLELYLKGVKPTIISLLEGYNSTIFAYGQTGTGKTYTMEGFTFNPFDEKRGLVPRVVEEIFKNIQNLKNNNKDDLNDLINNENGNYKVKASYLQIYNEFLNDLLIPETKNLLIREDKIKGIYIDNLSEWEVKNSNDIYTLLERGSENRATSCTNMNEVSSRSHAIFLITLEQHSSKLEDNTNINGISYSTKISKLNLVDLAGSERTKVTGAKGKQLEESKRINKSLSALGNVINALTDPKGNAYIPYRDSKLTRLLQDSLGGNCKTTMITMISPSQNFISETLSSLSFSKRAKKIKNKPKINEEINHKDLISQYEIQLNNLKNELSKKNELLQKNIIMKQVHQLTEEKKQIMDQLEQTSQKYYKERDEKKKLENKIQALNSNLEKYKNDSNNFNHNANKSNNINLDDIDIEKTPQFISALEKRQNALLKEFDNKLQEFQRENILINNNNNNSNNKNNDNEEIERYKQLILKDREMMSTLTKKINEREEAILQLQEDNEVFEKINEQQDNYIFLLNQNFTNLIEYCKQKIGSNDTNLQKYINSYKKINSDINNNKLENNNNDKNKKNAKKEKTSSNTKKYLPYNYKNEESALPQNSILSNTNSIIDSNVVLLTADEKIKELKGIIQEKENEINILKLVSQKFLSTSCESEGGKVQLEQIQKSFQNGFELHTKIRELEDKRQNLENENEILNDKLMEFQNNIFKIQNILDDIKLNNLNNQNIVPSKNDSLEKIVYNLDMNQAINDMCKIVNKLIANNSNNFINECDIKDNKDKFEFNKKIQQILNYNDNKNVNNISNEYLNLNNDFNIGNNKKSNIGTNSNSLSYKQLAKKQHKKEGEQKFFNKFVNIDK